MFAKGIRLRTQFFLIAVVLILSTHIASMYLNLRTTSNYLEQEVAQNTSNALSSLGLAITPFLSPFEQASVQVRINAVFDNGLYQRIELINSSGEQVAGQTWPDEARSSIPDWFETLFSLKSPTQAIELSAGWLPFGVLIIEPNIDLAYQNLWRQAQESMFSFLITLVLAVLAFSVLATWLLKSLGVITRLAERVGQKQFDTVEHKSATLEFNLVLATLNKMVESIRKVFEQQAAIADKLKQQLFIDDRSGLKNRKAFDAAFSHWHSERPGSWLVVVKLSALARLNDEKGYEAGDQLLKECAKVLEDWQPDSELYRLSGSELAMLKSPTEEDVSEARLRYLEFQLQALEPTYPTSVVLVAARLIESSNQRSTMMAIDARLSHRLAEPSDSYIVETSADQATSFVSWRELVESLQDLEDSLSLNMQKAAPQSAEYPEYSECYARFDLPENVRVADLFSMAERYGYAGRLDQMVLKKVLSKTDSFNGKLAVNICFGTLNDDEFLDWLTTTRVRNASQDLVFEISEQSIVRDPEVAKHFINRVTNLGFDVCIERFGTSLSSLRYLKNLNIAWVKMEATYLQQVMQEDPEGTFFRSIISMAHGAGAMVMVGQIQDPSVQAYCETLGVDYLQGNQISEVEVFK